MHQVNDAIVLRKYPKSRKKDKREVESHRYYLSIIEDDAKVRFDGGDDDEHMI